MHIYTFLKITLLTPPMKLHRNALKTAKKIVMIKIRTVSKIRVQNTLATKKNSIEIEKDIIFAIHFIRIYYLVFSSLQCAYTKKKIATSMLIDSQFYHYCIGLGTSNLPFFLFTLIQHWTILPLPMKFLVCFLNFIFITVINNFFCSLWRYEVKKKYRRFDQNHITFSDFFWLFFLFITQILQSEFDVKKLMFSFFGNKYNCIHFKWAIWLHLLQLI